MTRYTFIAVSSLALLSMLFMTLGSIAAFTLRPSTVHSPTFASVGTTLFSNNGDTDENEKAEFNWLEEWAMEGKDAVALMKTAERTQRAMLAQMTEDRIYEITKVLDTLVDEATGQISEADMPKAKELAIQTRNLQKEYKDLVTGAPSTMLETLASLNLSDDGKMNDGDNDKK